MPDPRKRNAVVGAPRLAARAAPNNVIEPDPDPASPNVAQKTALVDRGPAIMPAMEPIITRTLGPYPSGELRPARDQFNRPLTARGDITPSFLVLAEFNSEGAALNGTGGALVILYGRPERGPRIPLALAYLAPNAPAIVPIFEVQSLGYRTYEFDVSAQGASVRLTLYRGIDCAERTLVVDARARLPLVDGVAGWTDPSSLPTIRALLALSDDSPFTQWDEPLAGAVASKVVRTLPGQMWDVKGLNMTGDQATTFLQYFDAVAVPANNARPMFSIALADGANVPPFPLYRSRVLRNGLVWAASSTGDILTNKAAAKLFINTEHGGS